MIAMLFVNKEDAIDPEILDAIEWFWAEEYLENYVKSEV